MFSFHVSDAVCGAYKATEAAEVRTAISEYLKHANKRKDY